MMFNSQMSNIFEDLENKAKERAAQKAEVDRMLESPETTVGELFSLDKQEKQDEVMNQLRWGNKKVVQFFNNKRISELVDYITLLPPEGCSHDRGHKYPFLANQIFCEGGDGVPVLVEHFFYSQRKVMVKKTIKNDDNSNKSSICSSDNFSPIVLEDKPPTPEFQDFDPQIVDEASPEQNVIQGRCSLDRKSLSTPQEIQMEDFEFGEARDGDEVLEIDDEDGDDAFGQYIDHGKMKDEVDPFIRVEAPEEEDDPFASAPDPVEPTSEDTWDQTNVEQKETIEPKQMFQLKNEIEVQNNITKPKEESEETNEDRQRPEEDEDLDQDRIEGTDESQGVDQGKTDEERQNQKYIEDFMATFSSKSKNVKKSFELKYEMEDEEDDAAVFIVHEEEDNEEEHIELGKKDLSDQDELFVQQPDEKKEVPAEKAEVDSKLAVKAAKSSGSEESSEKIEVNTEDIDTKKKSEDDSKQLSPEPQIENPFKDNLANSEMVPTIQRLGVVINDNYVSPNKEKKKQQAKLLSQSVVVESTTSSGEQLQDLGNDEEDGHAADADKPLTNKAQTASIHQEMVMKRKKNVRGKKQNLSIHQFDESMQKTIQDTVEKERLQIYGEQPKTAETMKPKSAGGKADGTLKNDEAGKVVLVDDHFSKKEETAKNEEDDDEFIVHDVDDRDGLNDRVLQEDVKGAEGTAEGAAAGKEQDEEDPIVDAAAGTEDGGGLYVNTQKQESVELGDADEEDDNILRPPTKGKKQKNVKFDDQTEKVSSPNSEESPTSPTSPESPGLFGQLTTAKYLDQVSIEIQQDQEEKIEKMQDYTLIDRFFSFLDIDQEAGGGLNSTLCGYFCKVLQIMISHEPKEIFKYFVSTKFRVLDQMVNRLDEKSICEIFIKVYNEILSQANSNQASGVPPGIVSNPAPTPPQQQNQDVGSPNELQQSGQSNEAQNIDANKSEGQKMMEKAQKKLNDIILEILEHKLNESSSIFNKMGAFEVLQELLKNKECYQTLTTKRAFGIITQHLVSDSQDTKKYVYHLLTNLIQLYEKHERFEKRINIDNFSDEDLMNSHSGSGFGGSFNDDIKKGKKSRNSKKQNQDVMKDIQESDLFQFAKVVIQEISAQAIEEKFELIQDDKEGKNPVPLTLYFIALIEFIEKASMTFSGFAYDINQLLIDKDIFNYMFDILEYYKLSDFLSQKVFKLIDQMIKAKNDDIQDMIKYLLEDTRLINFLIQNGPKVLDRPDTGALLALKEALAPETSEPSTPEAKKMLQIKDQELDDENNDKRDQKEQIMEKSPEQSTQNKEESARKLNEMPGPRKIMIMCKETTGLQAYVKKLSELLMDYQKKEKEIKTKQEQTTEQNYNSQQSGSKSSEIIIETEEEQQIQKVCKVVVLNLNENQEWLSYVRSSIEPILEMEKGKLCKDEERERSSDNNSDNNIFDDDFMRSDFGLDGTGANDNEKVNGDLLKSPEKRTEGDEEDADDDENDHQKFFKKMQKCFSSNNSMKKRKNSDHIDIDERQEKEQAYRTTSEVNADLKAHLSATDDFDPKIQYNHMPQKRDRSDSNDGFTLPNLPCDEENRDISNLDNPDFQLDNYKSNEKQNMMFADIVVEEEDAQELSNFAQQSDKPSLDINILAGDNFGLELELDDVDIDLGDMDDGVNRAGSMDGDGRKRLENQLKDFDFFGADILSEAKQIMNEELRGLQGSMDNNGGKEDDEAIILSSKAEKSQTEPTESKKELDEFKSIFDQIDELDNILAMDDDEDDVVDVASQELNIVNSHKQLQEVKYGTKSEIVSAHTEGIEQSIDEIEKDFPGILINQDAARAPNAQKDQNSEEEETSSQLLHQPKPQRHTLANSEYIPTKSTNTLLEEAPEYHDNEFWDMKKSQMENYDIDDLMKELE